MQFSASEKISAPIEQVFRACTDFETYAQMAQDHGASVSRSDQMRAPGAGMGWSIGFRLRGRNRKVEIEMTEFAPPRGFTATSVSGGLDTVVLLDLARTSSGQTRVTAAVDATARTMPAKIVLQSLKLVLVFLLGKVNLLKKVTGVLNKLYSLVVQTVL